MLSPELPIPATSRDQRVKVVLVVLLPPQQLQRRHVCVVRPHGAGRARHLLQLGARQPAQQAAATLPSPPEPGHSTAAPQCSRTGPHMKGRNTGGSGVCIGGSSASSCPVALHGRVKSSRYEHSHSKRSSSATPPTDGGAAALAPPLPLAPPAAVAAPPSPLPMPAAAAASPAAASPGVAAACCGVGAALLGSGGTPGVPVAAAAATAGVAGPAAPPLAPAGRARAPARTTPSFSKAGVLEALQPLQM